MTFIAVNMEEVEEQKNAPIGRYDLQVTKCDITKSGEKSRNPGRPQYRVSIGYPSNPEFANLTHFISLPHEDDEPDSAKFKTLLLKRFLVLFSLPFNNKGFDIEGLAMQMVGATAANAEVGLGDPNENGDVYNVLKVPKIPGEPQGRGTPPTGSRRR